MAVPMKQGLDAAAVQRIADAFAAVDPQFRHRQFVYATTAGVRGRELRQRVDFLLELLV